MNRHEFLSGLHERYAPGRIWRSASTTGRGLTQSRTRTIGVDPEFKITAELSCDLQLAKATSDDFFARDDAIGWFPEGVIDLAFIDGLHIFEFALRDFINTERLSTPAGVVVFDDMLPRTVDEAARDRHTAAWTGDVYKVTQVLAKYRPDLTIVPIDTEPTGLLLVVGLDPTNTVLTDHYDEILAAYAGPDPQDVPEEYIHRTSAADPDRVHALQLWSELAAGRATNTAPASFAALAELRGSAKFVWEQPNSGRWPPRTPEQRAMAKLKAEQKAAKQAAPKKAPAKKAAAPVGTVQRIRKAIKRRL